MSDVEGVRAVEKAESALQRRRIANVRESSRVVDKSERWRGKRGCIIKAAVVESEASRA
jgi:hypothetical protein